MSAVSRPPVLSAAPPSKELYPKNVPSLLSPKEEPHAKGRALCGTVDAPARPAGAASPERVAPSGPHLRTALEPRLCQATACGEQAAGEGAVETGGEARGMRPRDPQHHKRLPADAGSRTAGRKTLSNKAARPDLDSGSSPHYLRRPLFSRFR